jgi:hypothetical protein
MKPNDITSRVIGFSIPIFGVSWTRSGARRRRCRDVECMRESLSVSIEDLRIQLDKITSRKDNRTMQPALVAAISGCTVRPIPRGDPRWPNGEVFNCFEYALDLVDSDVYRLLTEQFRRSRVGADDGAFVRYLIEKGVLHEVPQNEVIKDGIVVYFKEQEPQHAGRLFGARVASKWGDGLLWDHEILEVPIIYGDGVLFYRHLTLAAAESAFRDYVTDGTKADPDRIERLLNKRRRTAESWPNKSTR